MANINFDQLELEIQRAENYLSQAPNRASTPQDDDETLFFASDISQAPKRAGDARVTEDAVLSFGSAREPHDVSENMDPPMYYDESLMHTLRFGASRDSDVQSEDRSTSHTGEPYRSNRETLFYASDVLPGGGANYGNDELSFQPSPDTTPRDSAPQNRGSSNYFSESLADTVRFTKPIEPAVRSMEQSIPLQNLSSSSRPPIVKSAIRKPAKSSAVTSTATNNQDDHDGPTPPRKYVPRAQSPAKFTQRVPSTEPVEVVQPKRAVSAMSMERIEELHRTRLVRQQEMLKQKRALDELQLAECTFKPDISKGSRTILQQKAQFEQLDADLRHGGDENVDYDSLNGNVQTNPALHVSERLFREAEIRNAQNKWIKQQVNILRDSQYTYQPMINPSNNAPSSSAGHRPIHERIADMMKEKKQYMQTLRAAVEEEEVDLTFKPQIDARSRLIATQRLMGYGGNANLPRPPRSTSATRQTTSQPAPPSSSATAASHTASRPSTAPSSAASARGSAHAGGAGGSGMTGEQEAALVLGFHTDVASRLLDQGRAMAKRKQQLVHERDNELASAMEQVAISKGSERIVQAADLKGTFEERQAQYRERERKRQETLQKEQAQVTNSWFKPTIGAKSADIVSKHRPEILLESAEQKMERLSVKDAQDIEERRRRRAAELYGAIPFTPAIDPLSRMLGRSSSIEDLMHNRRGVEVRERIRRRVEEEANQECTFHPQINELSKALLEPNDDDLFLQQYNRDYAQVGWAQAGGCPLAIDQSIRDSVQRAQNGRINMQEPELMARNIRLHLLEKEEKRRSELITREIEELKDCTFRPAIESSLASLERQRQDTSPVVIRGLGRYLELKHLTAKQKEDALQREKEVFSVKNVDKFRRPEDGSTMVQSFNFSLVEPRQHSRLDISSADEVVPGSLNASTIISHKSHRQATSPAALAAWCV